MSRFAAALALVYGLVRLAFASVAPLVAADLVSVTGMDLEEPGQGRSERGRALPHPQPESDIDGFVQRCSGNGWRLGCRGGQRRCGSRGTGVAATGQKCVTLPPGVVQYSAGLCTWPQKLTRASQAARCWPASLASST